MNWKDEINAEVTRRIEKLKAKGERIIPERMSVFAEVFFYWYPEKLVVNLSRVFRKPYEKLEGGDIGAGLDILGEDPHEEVKGFNNFLTRNDTENTLLSTIPFEIFHKWTGFDKMYAGWLLSAYHPEEYCKIRDLIGNYKRAVQPGVYAFIPMGSDGTPFASIVFEDIPKLLNRLRELCPDAENWGINDLWQLRPATDREYWGQYQNNRGRKCWWDQKRGGLIQNCWHVPFSSLYDIATVTMINWIDPAEELRRAVYKCANELAEARYKNLQWVADQQQRGEHFNPDTYKRPNEHLHPIQLQGEKAIKAQQWHDIAPGVKAIYTDAAHKFVPFESNDGVD